MIPYHENEQHYRKFGSHNDVRNNEYYNPKSSDLSGNSNCEKGPYNFMPPIHPQHPAIFGGLFIPPTAKNGDNRERPQYIPPLPPSFITGASPHIIPPFHLLPPHLRHLPSHTLQSSGKLNYTNKIKNVQSVPTKIIIWNIFYCFKKIHKTKIFSIFLLN